MGLIPFPSGYRVEYKKFTTVDKKGRQGLIEFRVEFFDSWWGAERYQQKHGGDIEPWYQLDLETGYQYDGKLCEIRIRAAHPRDHEYQEVPVDGEPAEIIDLTGDG